MQRNQIKVIIEQVQENLADGVRPKILLLIPRTEKVFQPSPDSYDATQVPVDQAEKNEVAFKIVEAPQLPALEIIFTNDQDLENLPTMEVSAPRAWCASNEATLLPEVRKLLEKKYLTLEVIK